RKIWSRSMSCAWVAVVESVRPDSRASSATKIVGSLFMRLPSGGQAGSERLQRRRQVRRRQGLVEMGDQEGAQRFELCIAQIGNSRAMNVERGLPSLFGLLRLHDRHEGVAGSAGVEQHAARLEALF